MAQPTFVLVHGAWHGAWSWRDLAAEFDRRGAAWRSLDLPSGHDDATATSELSADVAAVVATARDVGPVVLVGHSYGGAVIADAASSVPGLVGLVFLAALVHRPGESASDANREVRVRTALDEAIVVDGGLLRLDPAGAALALYGDCSVETTTWAVKHLGAQTLVSFRSPRSSPDADVSRRYVLCRRDRALDPTLQEAMAARCDDIVELESDHSPFLSHPAACAAAILAPTRD